MRAHTRTKKNLHRCKEKESMHGNKRVSLSQFLHKDSDQYRRRWPSTHISSTNTNSSSSFWLIRTSNIVPVTKLYRMLLAEMDEYNMRWLFLFFSLCYICQRKIIVRCHAVCYSAYPVSLLCVSFTLR